jgi:hypothetical protein
MKLVEPSANFTSDVALHLNYISQEIWLTCAPLWDLTIAYNAPMPKAKARWPWF